MENRLKQSKYKTLVKFKDGIEIKADPLCWVLYIPSPRTYWFYSTLDQLFSDFLNLKIKELASKDSRKTVESLGQAIQKAHSEVKEIISSLTVVKIPDQRRLDLQESPGNQKDD